MLKAIVFDFGGVLVRTEDQTSRRRWELQLGLAERELARLVFDSDIANRATVGDADEAAVWSYVASQLKLEAAQLAALQSDFWAADKLDEDLVALVRALRPQYQTAILSNAWASSRELFTRKFGLGTAVDVIFLSSEERLAKPDPRLYQRVAERLGVQPGEAVLVDDFLANVEGARAAGWQAIHYRAGMDVRAALAELGVTVPTGARP